MTNLEPLVSIDLGQRTVARGYEDSIAAVADTILRPEYAATGDALDWALYAGEEVDITNEGYRADIDSSALCTDLNYILEEGIEHLYQATGLYAAADGISGMFFIAPEEFFSDLGA